VTPGPGPGGQGGLRQKQKKRGIIKVRNMCNHRSRKAKSILGTMNRDGSTSMEVSGMGGMC
jgi:hypothetical protein